MSTLTDQSYRTLGGVALALVFLVVLLSLLRAGYNLFLIVKEYRYKDMKDKVHLRQGQIIRQDNYYGSDD